MQKAAKHLCAILGRVLFIGLSVQMVLGLFWVCCNFASFPEYELSYFLQEVSESLVCDEYTGILYPFLIRMARGIASVIHVPYYCLLYLLQLASAFSSAYFFLGPWRAAGKKAGFLRAWGALVLVTVPVALQCHLAVLPYSLAGSLILVQLGVLGRALSCGSEGAHSLAKGEAREPGAGRSLAKGEAIGPGGACSLTAAGAAVLGICWLLEALLLPEYLWFGVAAPLAYGLRGALRLSKKNLGSMVRVLLVTAAFLGLVPLASGWFTREGAWGRMLQSREAAAMRRNIRSCFGTVYMQWPQELKDCLADEDIVECDSYADGMLRVLGKKVDQVYGREKAREIYRQMAELGWVRNHRQVKKEILMDLAGYGAAPIAQLFFFGRRDYESYTGRNYDIMRTHAPRLTARMVRFGGWCFVLGLAVTGFWQIADWIGLPGRKRHHTFRRLWEELRLGVFTALLGAGICIWYTMQGSGVMDAKKSMVVTVLWFAWMCSGAMKGIGRERQI